MDIDLLFSETNEAGLICNGNLVKKVAGVLIDPSSGLLTIEYTDMDFLELNVPVDDAYFYILEHNHIIHIGAVKNDKIAQAYQIPLMFLDNPYRGANMGRASQARSPLLAFERFVKSAINGQPVHREDLGDEASAGCLLGDATPSSLEFAPHLARKHAVEMAPSAAPKAAPTNAPRGPSGPGGMGGGGGGGMRRSAPLQPPPRDDD